MQHEAVWILPPQGESEGPTFITRTAPITQRPITYLLIGLLSLFGTHARAKSSDRRLTCADAGVERLRSECRLRSVGSRHRLPSRSYLGSSQVLTTQVKA